MPRARMADALPGCSRVHNWARVRFRRDGARDENICVTALWKRSKPVRYATWKSTEYTKHLGYVRNQRVFFFHVTRFSRRYRSQCRSQ